MNRENKPKYWVVASGDNNHDCKDVFLDLGVMAIGPGDLGNYNPNKKKYEKECGKNHIYSISLISDNKLMRKGRDFVVLRSGTKKIVAIGKIKSDYKWGKILEEIYGWSLQHYREVDWKSVDKELSKSHLFGYSYNLCRLSNEKAKDINNKFGFNNIRKKRCKIAKKVPKKIKQKRIYKYLKKKLFDKLIKIIDIYDKKNDSTEQDIVTFLVVPLLEGIGWKCEDIQLNEHVNKEHGFADVVLRKKGKPFCVIETKYFYQGLGKKVKEQALSYVRGLRKNKERKREKFPYFLLTDGKHYYLYKSNKPNLPYTYINIDKGKLYNHHPLFRKIKGALDFLKIMKR